MEIRLTEQNNPNIENFAFQYIQCTDIDVNVMLNDRSVYTYFWHFVRVTILVADYALEMPGKCPSFSPFSA